MRALHVTASSAARWASDRGTAVGAAAQSALSAGEELNDALLGLLLEQRLNADDALERGWILDGLPASAALASHLEAVGLMPHRLYDVSEAVGGAGEVAAPDSPLGKRGLVVHVDSTRNSWAQATAALSDLSAVLTQRQRHRVALATGQPAAVSDLGLTADEFAARLASTHGTFCPVAWARKRRLRRCLPAQIAADPRCDMLHAAEYRGAFYCCAGPSELTAFLVRPTESLRAPPLPKLVPTPLASAEAASELGTPALEGYCAVSLGRGPRGVDYDSRVESLRKGREELGVEYEGKAYLMVDERARSEFLQRPWRYAAAANPLPAKLPPNAIELIIKNLPIRGYLEQSMGDLLTEALTMLADLRPVYPTLDKRESALKFISLYIRAHNAKRRPPHLKAKFESSFLDYKDCCQAADKLIKFQAAGGSKAAGTDVPEDLERMNEMWDSIQKRDVRAFF
jgi:hypothetical protein